MRRPLLFILGVWILGELVVRGLGIALVPATPLDAAMEDGKSSVVRVEGTVRQVSRTRSGYSYYLAENQVFWEDEVLPAHSLLVFTDDVSELQIGNRVSVTGELSSFDVPGNPGQFDADGYYRALGVDFRLWEERRERLDTRRAPVHQVLYQLRETLGENLQMLTGEESGVFLSLLLGEKSDLSESIREGYRLAGMSHILAISGLHVSLFGMACYRLLRFVGFGAGMAGGIGSFFAGCYVVMSGASPSAVRALVMFGLFLLAQAAGRTYDMLSALGLAGLWLLWRYPLLLWQEGFQLSFLAIVGVGGVAPALADGLEVERGWQKSLIYSVSVQLVTLPVLVWHEGAWPVYGVFLNLLVIPLAGPLLASTALAALAACLSPVAARWLILPGVWIVRWFEGISEAAGRLPNPLVVTGQPAWWQILLYVMLLMTGIPCLIYWRKRARQIQENKETGKTSVMGKGGRRLVTILWIGLLVFVLRPLPFRGLQITFLDVGQGDCIFIRCEEGCLLIDGGSSSVSDVGKYRILPFLRHQGIRRLDAVLVTHGDADHMNGLAALFEDMSLTVDGLYISKASLEDESLYELRTAAEKSGVPVGVLAAGDGWQWGDTAFTCEYPFAGDVDFSADKNNSSLVLSVREEMFSALFMGDLEIAGEKALQESGCLEAVTLLKVGHHGSGGSSGEDFLGQVRPEIAVISCGANNRYGHPHSDTLQRLADEGAIIYSTPTLGAITLRRKDGFNRCYGFRVSRRNGLSPQ